MMYSRFCFVLCCVFFLTSCASMTKGSGAPTPSALGDIALTRAEYIKVRKALIRRRQLIKKLKAELLYQKSKAKLSQEKATKALRIRLLGCNKKLSVKCPPTRSCVIPMATISIVVGLSALVAGALAGVALTVAIK